MTAVVDFRAKEEVSEEETNRRIMAEAKRLAGLSPGEWRIWIDSSAERLGVSRPTLEDAVNDIIKDRDKKAREKAAEDRRGEQRAERSKEKAKREEKSKEQQKEKREEKEVKDKAKAKLKEFATIQKLPTAEREARLAKLAKQLDEDPETVRAEFADFIDTESSASPASEWHVEPWSEPVATAALLQELIAKINKHAIVRPHEAIAIALWIMLAWVHEIAAHYSPYLVATSAEPDSGKSTLIIDVVGRLTPRPFPGGEPTAATVYRTADAHKPTLLFDDVDTLFQRKPDLASIFKIGWTRGAKVPRAERVGGTWITVWYDPFCVKACTMIGTNIPQPLYGRCILIKMQPKLPAEKIEKPKDDDEFKELCRRLKRWSDDNALALKGAPPPTDFNNREADNWTLQLAIAKLAGSQWRKQALEAAERLCRSRRKPSWRQLLLAEFQAVFTDCKEITSEEFATGITADPLSIWREYNHGTGAVTQRQIAHLLSEVEIYPINIGAKRIRGYRAKDFADAFARYLPRDPLILSDGRK